MLRHETRFMNLQPRIPIYVSGFGPRAMALAGGVMATGWCSRSRHAGLPVQEALGHVRQGAARTGRDLAGFWTTTLTNVVVLEPGEKADSDRIKRSVGPNVMGVGLLFLRYGSGDRDGAASIPVTDLEAVLCTGGTDPAPNTDTSAPTSSTIPICIRAKPH